MCRQQRRPQPQANCASHRRVATRLQTTMGKSKQRGSKPSTPRRVDECRSEDKAAAIASNGTYARYKISTAAVKAWCDEQIGTNSRHLAAWSDAMLDLAARGARMPVSVANHLDNAIAARDQANEYYKGLQADCEAQKRHWHVCKLLRGFRRLFTKVSQALSLEQAAVQSEHSDAPANRFELLEVSEPSAKVDLIEVDLTDTSSPRDSLSRDEQARCTVDDILDDPTFAVSCLMQDAAQLREEARGAWMGLQWEEETSARRAPSAPHLLAASSIASFAMKKLERLVNATQLALELPDTRLDSLVGAMAPRVRLSGLRAREDLNDRCGTLGPFDPRKGRYAVALDEGESLSVKPKNVKCVSGWAAGATGTADGLMQVGLALTGFVPPSESKKGDEQEELAACIDNLKYVDGAGQSEWLEVLISRHLPLWLSSYVFAYGNIGAADTPLRQRLRETGADGGVSFMLAFTVLAAIDCMRACQQKISLGVLVAKQVQHAIQDVMANDYWRIFDDPLLEHECLAMGFGTTATGAHVKQIGRDIRALITAVHKDTHMVIALCPWIAGDVLLFTFRQQLVASTKVFWAWHKACMGMVHIYWGLRSAGYLHAIPDVEAFLGVYRQSVFYRFTPPRFPHSGYSPGIKVAGPFLKAWQLAFGAQVRSVANTGSRKAGMDRDVLYGRTGQHVPEVSLLAYILQYNGAGLDVGKLDVGQIARDEYEALLRAPLLRAQSILMDVAVNYGCEWYSHAQICTQKTILERHVNEPANAGKDHPWIFTLAPFFLSAVDGACPSRAEWEQCMVDTAQFFEKRSPGCARTPSRRDAQVPLPTFSPYTHVSPVAGDQGALASSYTPTASRLDPTALADRICHLHKLRS